MSLIRGVEICCYAGGFQPHQLAEEIIRKQITVYSGTPTVFHYLCRVMGKQKSHISLRYCNVGGEMMNRQTLTAIGQVLKGTQVIHSYGKFVKLFAYSSWEGRKESEKKFEIEVIAFGCQQP